jgi:hypothetical protein
VTVGTGDYEREEWRPQGERIGWLEDEDLYLEPDAALAAVQKQGRDSGEPLAVTGRTLRKRLHERGLLLSTDEARQVLTVRKTLEGRPRRDVLHTSVDFFSIHMEKPDQPDHATQAPHRHAESTPPLWSGSEQETRPVPEQEPDHTHRGRVINGPWSGQGTEPDQGPDQQEPPIHGENSGNGRVGQVLEAKGEENKGEGVHSRSGPSPAKPPDDAAWEDMV